MGLYDWLFGNQPPQKQQPQPPQRIAAPVAPNMPPPMDPPMPGMGGAQGGLGIPTPQPLPIMTGNTDFFARGHHIDPKTGDTRRDPQTGAPMMPVAPMGGASNSELGSTATVPAPTINAPLPPPRPANLGVRPPPGMVNAPLPPRRPNFADAPAPGASNAGPSAPATPASNPGYEYYQTTDDTGRTVWSTRPTGYAGAMPGAGDATARFQNAGSGMSYDQAQQSIGAGGAGSGFSGLMSALGKIPGPPGSSGGISVPPGALQGPMPNGQSLDQAQAPQAGGFQNPLVSDPNGSAMSNILKLFGIGGF